MRILPKLSLNPFNTRLCKLKIKSILIIFFWFLLRNENAGDSEKTFDRFMKDHQLETETQIPEVMAEAKFSIDNTEDGFEHLYKKIDKMMGEIKAN